MKNHKSTQDIKYQKGGKTKLGGYPSGRLPGLLPQLPQTTKYETTTYINIYTHYIKHKEKVEGHLFGRPPLW